MRDPRVERLAELLIGYSLEVDEGSVVRLDGSEESLPLLVTAHAAALRRGAHPYLNVELDGLADLKVAGASNEQLEYIAPLEWAEVDRLGALLTVWAEPNTRSFTNVDPDRHGRYLRTRRKLVRRRGERLAAGELTWCGTLFPTNAHAQDAAMSLREYEDFVFRACHVDEPGDAAAYWRGVGVDLEARARDLSRCRELRIVGPDTDLSLVVQGRSWVHSQGRRNMPDGEVFTSPVETATHGEIRYTLPAVFNGREVEDIRLRFEGGRVVAAEAARGGDYLDALLDLDAGSRALGEVAFGLNYEIDRFTRNILFDEKFGGTMHLALGSSFKQAGGVNESGLHWDMVCDLREDGEVYADGDLIWSAGRFLHPPEPEEATTDAG